MSVTNAKYGWADVEVTVYARNPSGAYRGTYSGFTIQARSGGYSSSGIRIPPGGPCCPANRPPAADV